VPQPQPANGEILVRVRAASVNRSDWEALTGDPFYARMNGLRRPRRQILGSDVAGTVEAVGTGHADFKPGDAVFGEMESYSDGFAETGPEGRLAQERILEIARAGGVRLIGPNCIGLMNTDPGCAISVNAVIEMAEIKVGPLAMVSQSGSMLGGLLSRGLGRGVGFSKLVSVGNESDLSVGEFADLLVDDTHTQTIAMQLIDSLP
jgi:hypothetical protein